jgi:mono/diheme cytochrome c family protein
VAVAASAANSQQAVDAPTAPAPSYLAQGWSGADRETFYNTGQGSHLIPYVWFTALRRLDVDEPFAGDQLRRYGYLKNDSAGARPNLPVGFVVGSGGQLGITCAACHTRQIEFTKNNVTHVMRIDGAPANSDFQQFLTDLAAAARETVSKDDRFQSFARNVLGNGYTTAKAARLKIDFRAWTRQFADFMDASLPKSAWGPGRLDAFGMIFNRVAARDLGVAANFRVADAPVSYPFLWNASRQDRTQWNGGVRNGLFLQALARNSGEVLGVFADFKPKVKLNGPFKLLGFNDHSADFAGLQILEEKIAILQPPPWPRDLFGFDADLAARGKPLFDQHCAQCHGISQSPDLLKAWATPIKAVGTDPKMAENAARMSDPGMYAGSLLPPPAIAERFSSPANTSDILAASVVGMLTEEAFTPPITPEKVERSGVWHALRKDLADLLPNERVDDLIKPNPILLGNIQALARTRLTNLFKKPATADAGAAYESRVLRGIWATAPYLHNGSVASLWELLKPATDRQKDFMVGSPVFDPKNVGYVTTESPFATGKFVTDPDNANGNGNGGHEYGTQLSEDARWAIVEYLKSL